MGTARLIYAALVWSLTFSICVALRIAWLVPGPDSSSKINSDTSVAALKLALRSVEKTSKGSGKNVGIKFFDTDCTSQAATSSMFAQRAYSPDVIIGPPCKAAMKSVAQLAGFWNVPLFGWYNPDIEFDSTKDYPTLIRMTPSANIMAKSLIHIMHQNGWRRFVLLHDVDGMGLTIKEALTDELSRILDVQMFSARRLEDSLTNPQLAMMFNSIKKHVTIIVFACSGRSVRRYLLAADKVGMTNGQYVFIQLDYEIYSGSHLKDTLLADGSWRRGDLDDADARRAYETLIHVILDPMSDDGKNTRNLPKSRYEEFSQLAIAGEGMKKPEWQLPGISKKSASLFPSSMVFPDVYSLYLYDSVVVWSVLVDVLNRSGIDHRNGQLVAHMAKNFFADGATGFIQINENLDRVGKVYILDMGYNGNFKPVQVLRFNSTNGYSVKHLVPFKRMFRWSSRRRGILQTPSDIPPKTTSITTPRLVTTTTTTTTIKPTTTTATTTTTKTTTTTTAPTTTKPTTTSTAAPDPMALIMDRLAALEAFLTKSDNSAKPPPNTKTQETTVKPNTKPQRRNRKRNRQGLKALKDSFAENAQARKRKRGRKGQWTKGARRTGKQSKATMDVELERRTQNRLQNSRKNRPTTKTVAPYEQHDPYYDWYETSTPHYEAAPPADYPAALDQLFAAAVDTPAGTKRGRMKNNGRAIGGRPGGKISRMKQTGKQKMKQQSPTAETGFKVIKKNALRPVTLADTFASDPMIDQISAKVAARISKSISKKLSAAKETIKKQDNNYAVHIIGDWIPGSGEDGAQKMNMTVKVDKTNNKDLKVTAQGMTVDNTISRKTIDTAKNKTTSVTIEPPKPSEKDKPTGKKITTTQAYKDLLTVTVAPPPPQMMYHPPWPYMYPVDPSSWQSGESEQQQSHYEQPPQYAYPPPMYPYPPGNPQQPPSNQEGGGNTPYPPYPPPGYAPYPMYPMHGRYPSHWGQQHNSEV